MFYVSMFWDRVIYFGLTRCHSRIFSNAENVIKTFLVGRVSNSLFQSLYSLKASLLNKSVTKEPKVYL